MPVFKALTNMSTAQGSIVYSSQLFALGFGEANCFSPNYEIAPWDEQEKLTPDAAMNQYLGRILLDGSPAGTEQGEPAEGGTRPPFIPRTG